MTDDDREWTLEEELAAARLREAQKTNRRTGWILAVILAPFVIGALVFLIVILAGFISGLA